MNINKSFFKWCGILASVLTLAVATNSCTVDDRMMVELVELGALNKDYVVNAEAGDTIVKVYSNLEYRIKPVEDVDWARLSVESNVGDSDFSIEYDFNEGFPRMAKFLVYNDVDSRCDTIYFKQKGLIEPTLMMPNTALISTGSGGEQVAEIVTNIDMDDMEISIVYPEGESEEWIKDINISEGFIAKSSDIASSSLVVNTNPNLDAERPRTATIMILYVDDWGVEHPLNINVTQKNANEGIGRELTFDQVRAEYGDLDGIKVEDYVCIKGIVISDKSSGNAGENPQVTFQSIDYSGAKKTVYIQSLDGTRGFRVETVSEGDNIFEQYSQVEIQLRGSVVYYEENPERYIIKEVTSSMVTQNNAGDASDVVAKEMYMGELTPEDIYTWVSLKDCEFPIRKGALTPFNEGYTLASAAHRVSKYPTLIRDIQGNDMYVYTNSTCGYRRDGERLPYGSGRISGVVVHEKFTRFVFGDGADESEYGNIGNYQLRHMSKADIEFASDFKDSYSELLTEYRFQNPKGDGTSAPTYGTNGWLTHTYQEKYTHDEKKEYLATTYQTHFWGGGEATYLGPVGNSSANPPFFLATGNKNGLGIILDPEKEHYNSNMKDWVCVNDNGELEWGGANAVNSAVKAINSDGKGNVAGTCYTTFGSNYWWDEETDRPYGWMINFSTEGIVTDQLSMQIAVQNTSQTSYTPHFWKAEWSTVDSMDPEDDDQWKLIGEYDVPDIVVWSGTLLHMLNAQKYINFKLPQEMLGKENVYVRLVPRNAMAGNGKGFANSFIYHGAAGKSASVIGYFAVRYNK